jgi:hypothetical protein
MPDDIHAEYLRLRDERDAGRIPYWKTNRVLRREARREIDIERNGDPRTPEFGVGT